MSGSLARASVRGPASSAAASQLAARLTELTRAGVVVAAAAMPLYIIRLKVGQVPTTLLEIAVLLAVGLYTLTVVIGRGQLPGRTAYDIPIGLLLIAGLIGVFVAPDHRGALGIYRAYLIEPVVLFYITVAVFDRGERLKPLLAAVAGATILYCLVEGAFFTAAVVRDRLVPGHAAAAFGLNPNYVAMYLEPLIGVAVGFALFGRARHRAIALVTLAALLPAEVATFSRGGLVVLAVIAAIVFVTFRSRVLRAVIVASGALGAVVIWNLPELGSRVRELLFSPHHGTLFNRTRIWTSTFRMLGDHRLFGAGLNSYQQVMAPYRAGDPFQVPEPYPHNIALTSWTELGLLGLVAFAWILVALIVRSWKAFGRAAGIERAILWGAGAAFVMVAVHGLVDSPYWKNDLSVEFWLLAALSVVAGRSAHGAASAAQTSPRP